MSEETESYMDSNDLVMSRENQNQYTGSSLDSLYDHLLSDDFESKAAAIKYCRDLCAQYGFTVKQEQSTHRNIYVYCSREGFPDSHRNPKSTPRRKRPSKRCDCRWRVVLFEKEGDRWEFRKSLNPTASRHNHELMRPEEIEMTWPKEVAALIGELASQRLPTQDIRARVQTQFVGLHWNERRFYNRLSEERLKIKQNETVLRAKKMTGLWTRICMATAGSEDLSFFVEEEMQKLIQNVCTMVQIDPETLEIPLVLSEKSNTSPESTQTPTSPDGRTSMDGHQYDAQLFNVSPSLNQLSDDPVKQENILHQQKPQAKTGVPSPKQPKGFTVVTIPAHSYIVKVHTQRSSNESPSSKNRRRSRSQMTIEDNGLDRSEAARKQNKRQNSLQITTKTSPVESPKREFDNSPSLSDASSHLPTASQAPKMQYQSIPMVSNMSQRHMPMTGQGYVYPSNYESSIIPLDTSFSNYVPNSLHQYTAPRMGVPTDFSMTDSMYLPTSIGSTSASQARVNDSNIDKKYISSSMLPGLKTSMEMGSSMGKHQLSKPTPAQSMTTNSFSNRRSGNQAYHPSLSSPHSHQQYSQASMYSNITNAPPGEFSSSIMQGSHMMKDDGSPYPDSRSRSDDMSNTHDISFARMNSGAPIGKEDERDKREHFYSTGSPSVNNMFIRQTTNIALPPHSQQQQQQQSHNQALLPHPSLQTPPFLMYSAGYPPPPTPPPYVNHLDHGVLDKKNEGHQPGLCYRNVDQYQ